MSPALFCTASAVFWSSEQKPTGFPEPDVPREVVLC